MWEFQIGWLHPSMKFDSGLKKMVWRKFNYNAIESKNLVYTLNSNPFLIGRKSTVNFRNQCLWCHNCRLYDNHVQDTQGHGKSCHVWPQSMISEGNHVNFARFMLLAVSDEEEIWLPSQWMINLKQLLDTAFVISRIIKVSLRFICLSLRLRLKTPYSTLIFLDITKNKSNIG